MNRLNNKTLTTKIFLIISFIQCTFLINGWGQDCKKLVLDYISKVSMFKQPEKNKVFYMQLIIKTRLKDNNRAKIPDIEGNVFVSHEGFFYDSNLVSVYKDNNDLFYLNHIQKQILRTKPEKFSQNFDFDQTLKAQKEFIQKGIISHCIDTLIGAKLYKVIKFFPTKSSESSESYKNLKVITYYYLQQEKRVNQVIIEYDKLSSIQSQTLFYKQLDFNYKRWDKKNAAAIIFDSSGKLRPKYNLYSITDNRI